MKEGRVHRELQFSLARGNLVLRGAIDSLVLLPGKAVVIDYKTGSARPEHRLQMEIYLEAAKALFPDRAPEGLVFYPRGNPSRVRLPQDGAGGSEQFELF